MPEGYNCSTDLIVRSHLPSSNHNPPSASHRTQPKPNPTYQLYYKPTKAGTKLKPQTTNLLFPLTILLSAASSVLADRKISYSCYDPRSSTRLFSKTWKSGSVVSDAFAEKIVQNMAEWSDHKYAAKYWFQNTVYVTCVGKMVATDAPLEAMAEQEEIVKEHMAKEGR